MTSTRLTGKPLFLALAVAMAWSFGAAQSGRHPAYTFTSLMKTDFKPIVGDIAWLPDGRLLVMTMVMKSHDHVSGPSDLYILDGVLEGGPEAVTLKKFASGFYTPQGVQVVDGQVFVLDNKEGIIRLVDANKDDVAESRSVVWSEGIKTADRKWSGGLAYKDGHFYVPISTRIIPGGRSDPTQGKWNGTVAKISVDGSKAEVYAGGIRNSNGIGWGPAGEMLVSDNQGDWTPASRLNEVRQGEFFGHKTTAFDTKTMTPPVFWTPHGEVANSPSNMIFLSKGPYRGQMLLGEVTNQRILRANLEKVNGRLQGCVFPFASNMPAGVQRLLEAPDGSGSIIVAGVGGDGGWTFKEPWYDLERLTPTNTVPFEMLAVRSMGSGSMEVEFTKPIAAADAVPARFQVSQWWYEPTAAYGGPKKDSRTLTVTAAALSADGRRVTLSISGLQTNRVVQVKLANLKSKEGESPYAVDGYYTLNAFGPGTPPVGVGEAASGARGGAWSIQGRGMEAVVRPKLAGPFTLRVLTPDGRVRGTFPSRREGAEWECPLPLQGLRGQGLLILEAQGARGTSRTKWMAP
jgi:glucose/arabinose dehydrogenase